MEIRFKGLHYDLPQEITERAQRKLLTLTKYLGSEADLASAYVELGKLSEAHQTGNVWQAIINLSVPGHTYRAEALESSMENAIDRTIDELSKEIRKARTKDRSLMRRGGLLLKSLMQGRGF